jgi:hypothetical protein
VGAVRSGDCRLTCAAAIKHRRSVYVCMSRHIKCVPNKKNDAVSVSGMQVDAPDVDQKSELVDRDRQSAQALSPA